MIAKAKPRRDMLKNCLEAASSRVSCLRTTSLGVIFSHYSAEYEYIGLLFRPNRTQKEYLLQAYFEIFECIRPMQFPLATHQVSEPMLILYMAKIILV